MFDAGRGPRSRTERDSPQARRPALTALGTAPFNAAGIGRVAQRESTPFTRVGSQVQSLSRPLSFSSKSMPCAPARGGRKGPGGSERDGNGTRKLGKTGGKCSPPVPRIRKPGPETKNAPAGAGALQTGGSAAAAALGCGERGAAPHRDRDGRRFARFGVRRSAAATAPGRRPEIGRRKGGAAPPLRAVFGGGGGAGDEVGVLGVPHRAGGEVEAALDRPRPARRRPRTGRRARGRRGSPCARFRHACRRS
jgi:hypothetical protein